jgi:hypothetical protein
MLFFLLMKSYCRTIEDYERHLASGGHLHLECTQPRKKQEIIKPSIKTSSLVASFKRSKHLIHVLESRTLSQQHNILSSSIIVDAASYRHNGVSVIGH